MIDRLLHRPIKIILLFSILIGCAKDQPLLSAKLEGKKENWSLYRIDTQSGDDIGIWVDSIGRISSIWVGRPGHVQKISLNDSTGLVQALLSYDKSNNINGRAYYFYEESGNLEADYNYINGVKTGNAVEYHDSTALLKTTMLYNEEGQMYFRLRYDREGNILSKEGSDGRGNQ
ncbi:MAG: hypothetical protein R2787_17820 [Saprospiraceae bacterium]